MDAPVGCPCGEGGAAEVLQAWRAASLPEPREVHSAALDKRGGPPGSVLLSGIAQSLGNACSVRLQRGDAVGPSWVVKSMACACKEYWQTLVCGHAVALVHAYLHAPHLLVDVNGPEVERIPWLSPLSQRVYEATDALDKMLIDAELEKRGRR